MPDLARLEDIARREFADIVTDGYRTGAELRLILIDGSYIDFWWSEVQEGRFAHDVSKPLLVSASIFVIGQED